MNNLTMNTSDVAGSDSESNGTRSAGPQEFLFFSPAYTGFILTALIAIIIAAVIGNTLVCIASCWNPNLRKATTSLFILSLAVSDLLTAMLSIPFDVDQILTNGLWYHGEGMCIIWTTAYLITVPTSNLTLLLLSVDRYLTLSKPLSHFRGNHFMTRGKVLGFIAALWIYSLVFALLPKMGWEVFRLSEESITTGGICRFTSSKFHSLMLTISHFILPALATGVVYVLIYWQIRKHTRTVRPMDSPVSELTPASFLLQRNIRAAKRIAVIVSVFLLCWVPYSTLSIIGTVCIECRPKISQEAFYVTLMMGYLNSALNPLLYSFNNRNFVDTYKRLYRMARRTCGRVGGLKK